MAVVTTNLGVVTAYGDAVAAGYTGTKEEFQALLAKVPQSVTDSANAVQQATEANQGYTELKSELTNSLTALGVYSGKFSSTGAAHSSADNKIAVDIKANVPFSVGVNYDITPTGYWDCFAYYVDGTNGKLFSYFPNQAYTTSASKDIAAIGIATAAQSGAYTCVITIDTDVSVIEQAKNNANNILALKSDLKDVTVNMSPITNDVAWEQGRINNSGGNQDSTTYVRTHDYIDLGLFDYIHLAEKCQIEVFFYSADSTKVGSTIYGSSSSAAQNIYLTRPTNTTKIRIVQYMHNTAWSTTVAYAKTDIQLLIITALQKTYDKALATAQEVGIYSKEITVQAGVNHSSTVEQDKIYIDVPNKMPLILSATSALHAKKQIQAFVYTDSSSTALASFYTDGRKTGITVDQNAKAIGFYIVNSASSVADTFTVNVELTDAITVDLCKERYSRKVENARHIPSLTGTPLTIFHFSDIHADNTVLARITNAINDLGINIDGAICTGDIVEDTAGQIETWWDENIMTCIGNHDCASKSGDVYDWTALSMADRDAYYIAPFESNWGITHTSGTSYYYKDYSTQRIRLIVMDAMLYNTNGAEATAQTTWLSNLLSDAITNNLHVLIAIHAPHGGATAKDCSFSKYGETTMPTLADCNTPQTVIDTIATAIGNGLKFIGYICGHTHQDNMWDAENDGKQLMYCITCAAVGQPGLWKNSDQDRSAIADAFNIVTIDTANTLVKIVRGGGADIDDHMRTRKAICFNYATGDKVGEVL